MSKTEKFKIDISGEIGITGWDKDLSKITMREIQVFLNPPHLMIDLEDKDLDEKIGKALTHLIRVNLENERVQVDLDIDESLSTRKSIDKMLKILN